jgi:G3E family GTPase
MSLFERDRSAERLPVSVITGFLGSGKTTLLQHLLQQRGMSDSAVIINELGEVGLDHLLIERIDGETVLLPSGCLCCALRSDLETTLRTMLGRMQRGEMPPFRRVLVETTGLADPAPICQLLLNQPLIAHFYRLDAVLTTIAAVHGTQQLSARREAVKQAALADRLLVTKTDLVDDEVLSGLDRRLAELNPAAPRLRVLHGRVGPEQLFGANGFDPVRKIPDVRQWLAAEAHETPHDHGHDGVCSFCIAFDAPLRWEVVQAWLARLRAEHGERLLRVKGILNLDGEPGPVVVHGVHHVFHPPVLLDAWPDADQRSRLVFVTDGLERSTIEEAYII